MANTNVRIHICNPSKPESLQAALRDARCVTVVAVVGQSAAKTQELMMLAHRCCNPLTAGWPLYAATVKGLDVSSIAGLADVVAEDSEQLVCQILAKTPRFRSTNPDVVWLDCANGPHEKLVLQSKMKTWEQKGLKVLLCHSEHTCVENVTANTFAVVVAGRFASVIGKVRRKLEKTPSRPLFCIVGFATTPDQCFAAGADLAMVESNTSLSERRQDILRKNPNDSWLWTLVVEDIDALYASRAGQKEILKAPVDDTPAVQNSKVGQAQIPADEARAEANWVGKLKSPQRLSAEHIPNTNITCIHDVFRANECDELIDCAESIGFSRKESSGKFRSIWQYEATDLSFTKSIQCRLEPWVPQTLIVDGQCWEWVGLNETWCWAKLYPGETPQRNHDFPIHRSDGAVGMFTVNIFMNCDFRGGKTRFYLRSSTNIDHEVNPKSGMAVLIPADKLYVHDSEEVVAGVKYLLRSDLMYRRCDSQRHNNLSPSGDVSSSSPVDVIARQGGNDHKFEIETHSDWAGNLHAQPSISVCRIDTKDAFLLEELFTRQECEALINSAESIGFGGTSYKKEYRGNLRLITTDAKLTAAVCERMEPCVPKTVTMNREMWDFVGLNECWRLAKYYPGDRFQQHCDAVFKRSQDEMSMYTVNIYMNADFTGGNTRFYFSGKSVADYEIQPKPGLCLVFRQPPGESYLHDGAEVTNGVKYLFRTDLMYRKRPQAASSLWPRVLSSAI